MIRHHHAPHRRRRQVPVVVHLRSPADRPIQATADGPRFWAGSGQAVGKEMAGRYPKHAWPADPTTTARFATT